MKNEVPLFQKLYDFYKLFYELLDHFPKKSREVLGRKIESTILELLEIISRASYTDRQSKIKDLEQASIKLDLLKILFRLAFELRMIDQKKYILLEKDCRKLAKCLVAG
jgi:hypothetical protein